MSDCITKRRSFAIKTTLRSEITFEQAQRAKAAGFATGMRFWFSGTLERVKQRADAGGHSASEATLRRIYAASLADLPRAVWAATSLGLP